MTRILPAAVAELVNACPEDLEPNRKRPGLKSQWLDIVVVTPMFGGGEQTGGKVTPTGFDSQQKVRPSSVRGHLRFWWRATRGRQFETVDELWKRECEIFGSTDASSRLSLQVDVVDSRTSGEQVQTTSAVVGSQMIDGEETLGYVLFPFAGDRNKPEAKSSVNVKFRLTMEYPESCEADIDAAMWGWLCFGGIGSRTRRGCGTLWSTQYLVQQSKPSKVESWLRKEFVKHCGSETNVERPWPTLSGAVLLRKQVSNEPVAAWAAAVHQMRHFRQGRGVAREQSKRYGKSLWPEARAIREAVFKGVTPEVAPRGEFGLPLLFPIKDEPLVDGSSLVPLPPDGGNDSTDDHLKSDRMASPVILKALAFGSSRNFMPMIARLNAPVPEMAQLRLASKDKHGRATHEVFLRDPDLNNQPGPMRGLSPNGSAVEAFWNFAQKPASKNETAFEEVNMTEVSQ